MKYYTSLEIERVRLTDSLGKAKSSELLNLEIFLPRPDLRTGDSVSVTGGGGKC